MSTGDHMFVARSMLFCGFWWLRGGEVAACSNQNGVCKIVGWCQIATTICSNCSYHAFILITEPLITHFAVALLAQTVKREFWSLWHTFSICIYIIDIWMHASNTHNMVINQSPPRELLIDPHGIRSSNLNWETICALCLHPDIFDTMFGIKYVLGESRKQCGRRFTYLWFILSNIRLCVFVYVAVTFGGKFMQNARIYGFVFTKSL